MMKKRRIRDYSTDYTYGYTTGYLGMWLGLRRGENAPALRITVRMLRTDYTGIFEDVVMPTKGEERASFEDDGEDDKDNDRTTEQRCKNRQDTPRTAKIRQEPPRYAEPDTPRYAEPDTPRYAEPAARVRYKYETCFGNNGRPGMIHMLCLPPLFYI